MNFREVVDLERTKDVQNLENADFPSLMLSEKVLTGLERTGFKKPSPVQLAAIPIAKLGLDVIVQAKSGTGKTCVFCVMALEAVVVDNKSPQSIILAPTREIATQIFDTAMSIGRCMLPDGLQIGLFIGGTPMYIDKRKLSKGCQIIVGSPGRLCQLVSLGDLSLNSVRLFVLDEADKLMEDSYQQNVNWLFSQLPKSKQVGVFSATYPSVLDEFLTGYMETATMVRLDSDDVQLLGIKQYLLVLPPLSAPGQEEFSDSDILDRKLESVTKILSKVSYNQCLVFCNYQDKAEEICTKLNDAGLKALFISSTLDQESRNNVIAQLKKFKCRILVSTDLTARGIDAQNVNFVINIEVPSQPETYFHRIGRAGRFGGYGAAITICVEGLDENRYKMIGSLGSFNARRLPPMDSLPSELCSDIDFWESQPKIVFPPRKSQEHRLESQDRYQLIQKKKGGKNVSNYGRANSKQPFKSSFERQKDAGYHPIPDPNRVMPDDLAQTDAWGKLFLKTNFVPPAAGEPRRVYSRDLIVSLNPKAIPVSSSSSDADHISNGQQQGKEDKLTTVDKSVTNSSVGQTSLSNCPPQNGNDESPAGVDSKSPAELPPSSSTTSAFNALFEPLSFDELTDGSCLIPTYEFSTERQKDSAKPGPVRKIKKADRKRFKIEPESSSPASSQDHNLELEITDSKHGSVISQDKNLESVCNSTIRLIVDDAVRKEEHRLFVYDRNLLVSIRDQTAKPMKDSSIASQKGKSLVNSIRDAAGSSESQTSPKDEPTKNGDGINKNVDGCDRPDAVGRLVYDRDALCRIRDGSDAAGSGCESRTSQKEPEKPGENGEGIKNVAGCNVTDAGRSLAYDRDAMCRIRGETSEVRRRLYVLTKWPLVNNEPFVMDPNERHPYHYSTTTTTTTKNPVKPCPDSNPLPPPPVVRSVPLKQPSNSVPLSTKAGKSSINKPQQQLQQMSQKKSKNEMKPRKAVETVADESLTDLPPIPSNTEVRNEDLTPDYKSSLKRFIQYQAGNVKIDNSKGPRVFHDAEKFQQDYNEHMRVKERLKQKWNKIMGMEYCIAPSAPPKRPVIKPNVSRYDRQTLLHLWQTSTPVMNPVEQPWFCKTLDAEIFVDKRYFNPGKMLRSKHKSAMEGASPMQNIRSPKDYRMCSSYSKDEQESENPSTSRTGLEEEYRLCLKEHRECLLLWKKKQQEEQETENNSERSVDGGSSRRNSPPITHHDVSVWSYADFMLNHRVEE